MEILSTLSTNYLAHFSLFAQAGLDKLNAKAHIEDQRTTQASIEADQLKRLIEHYRQLDQAAREHVQVQLHIARQYASTPEFTYQKAPDNRYYAVEGSVSFDTKPVLEIPKLPLKKLRRCVERHWPQAIRLPRI